MKNTCKILALVLVVFTVLMSLSVLTVSAAAGQTWTVAGVKALCGTDWDTANKNNDMTYDEATDSYVKVFTNVKAGNYQFKCAKDHKWDVAYPSSNYNLKVEKDGSTVTITLKGTTVTAKVEAPACDHKYEVTAATVTCLTGGSRTWTCSVCGDSYTEEKLDALGHSYDESGKCIRCDATTEFVRVYVENAAKWTEVYCYTWDTNPYVAWPGEKMNLDSESGLYYYDIPKNFVNVIFNNGGATQSADLKTPTGTATIYNNSTKAWSAPHVHEFVEGKCACGEEDPNYVPPHVNTLVVGDTNKIVIDGDQDNGYGYYIELVPFVAEEAAYYSFAGEGLTIWLYDAANTLISMTGAANIEAGTYYVFIAANTPATTGEFNVAVTKSAWLNVLVEGANKIQITDTLDNGAGYYIVWVPFEVTEKANYTFTGEGILALVYDAAYQAVAGTELEVGTYNICIAFLTPATTGMATVNVEKTAIGGGEEPPVVEDPALALGDNAVVIDGSQVNLTGNAVAWYTFTPETAGTYTFACSDLTIYILTSKNMGDLNAYVGNGGIADLEAGVTYHILVGKEGITGEFTVKVSLGGEVVEKNSLALGDNHYIVTDALISAKAEYLYLTITEPGTYVFTGGNPMKIYVWTIPVEDLEGGALTGTTPFIWNVDVMLGEGAEGVAPSFEVKLDKAGTYWVGFNYDFIGEDREFDINISLKAEDEQPPVDDEPTEEPKDEAPVAPEMNFFQKIIAWFMDLIQKLLAMFKK